MRFPEHKAGLFLTHNEHKNYYQTIPDYLAEKEFSEFKDEEAKRRSLETERSWPTRAAS